VGQKYFFKAFFFFFIPGPFQGGHFFGEIIYFSALDLKPASLNRRPAHLKAVTMGMVTAIALFWSNKPNPAIAF
jgi:hypothetical protein